MIPFLGQSEKEKNSNEKHDVHLAGSMDHFQLRISSIISDFFGTFGGITVQNPSTFAEWVKQARENFQKKLKTIK